MASAPGSSFRYLRLGIVDALFIIIRLLVGMVSGIALILSLSLDCRGDLVLRNFVLLRGTMGENCRDMAMEEGKRQIMRFSPICPEDHDAVREFLSELGWGARVNDPERFRRMMEGADRTVVAWEDGRVVGFGRAVCDGASNGYLSMLAVAPDRRRQGIGREIVLRLMGDDPEITWVLRAGRESRGFWERMGFTPSKIAMERVRSASQ